MPYFIENIVLSTLTRFLDAAFKSNSYTRNNMCFGYADVNVNTCKFKEPGQFYDTV